MNVAIICNSYPTKKNPRNQVFIKKLEDELVLQGMDVRVCYNKIFDVWGDANKSKNIFSNIIKYIVYTYSIGVFFVKHYRSTDVLFSQGIIFATFAAVLIKRITNIPVVCYIHGGDLNLYHNKKGVMNTIVRYSLNHSDVVVANSRDIYNKARKVSSNPNITIISPGVDLKIMRPVDNRNTIKTKLKIPQDKILFMAAGTAIKRKGFDLLLEALCRIPDKVRDKIFVFFLTDGPEQQSYIEFINEHHLQDLVSIRNRVSHEVLNYYYNIADFFVFPSRSEPLGLVGLEAMASNTIVIGAEEGGIKEFVIPGKTGFLFEKENVDDLAACIEKVVVKENNFESYYPEIKNMVKSHSLENSARELIELFKKIIRKGN